jgi:hypothetical protein
MNLKALKSFRSVVAIILLTATIGGCVVAAGPGVWVPGHYGPYGRWHHGHYVY